MRLYGTRSLSGRPTGPPVFHPDTRNPGVLHARKLYRELLAKRRARMEKLTFVFTDDGDMICLDPPD